MPADKPIVITITVLPLAKGKRKLIVSGAPQGEMPVVRTGEFAQVHQMVNAAWAELVKRKPQVPKLPKSNPANKPVNSGPAAGPKTTNWSHLRKARPIRTTNWSHRRPT